MGATAARTASRQHGLLLRSQAVAAGASDSMIETRLASGRWMLVSRGIYRTGGVPVTRRQRALSHAW